MGKPLTAAMDNLLAYRLGKIAREAGGTRTDVGDDIDRGLILHHLLDEAGFVLSEKEGSSRLTIDHPLAQAALKEDADNF